MKKEKAIKFTIIFALAFTLFFSFPQATEAVIGTGIFDFFIAASKGIKTIADNVAFMLLIVFFVVMTGFLFFLTSASLLQWVISNPQWLSLDNPIVDSGLYFVTGLTNLFIILVLIIIAFAWILKIESFAAKKALPKLIVVALLINFARVFIGIPIDFATILHRTILEAGDANIVILSMQSLFGGIEATILSIASYFVALSALFIVPFIKPFAAYAFVIFIFSSVLFLPIFLSWLIQTILSFILGGIFLTLAFLFASRIFVIWFLTIFAPLAALCWVLPQTRKHWDEWLNLLISWIFFGLLVLLFLIIGLTGTQYLAPNRIVPAIPFLSWFSLGEYFGFYFFLFVFLSVTSWMAKKTAPQMADTLLKQAAVVSGIATVAGGKLLKDGLQKSFQKTKQGLGESEKVQAWAARQRESSSPFRQYIGSKVGIEAKERQAQRISQNISELEKIQTPEKFKQKMSQAKTPDEQFEVVTAGLNRGGDFAKMVKEDPNLLIAAGARANKLGRKPEHEKIGRAAAGQISEEGYKQMGFKGLEQLKQENPEEARSWERKGWKTVGESLVGKAKKSEVKDFSKGFYKNSPELMGAVMKRGDLLPSFIENQGPKFSDDLMGIVEKYDTEKGQKKFAQMFPEATRVLSGNAGRDFGIRAPGNSNRDESNSIIREASKEGPPSEDTIKEFNEIVKGGSSKKDRTQTTLDDFPEEKKEPRARTGYSKDQATLDDFPEEKKKKEPRTRQGI